LRAFHPAARHQVVDQSADGALRESETSDKICLTQWTFAQLRKRVGIGDSGIESTRRSLRSMESEGTNERNHRIGETPVNRHRSMLQLLCSSTQLHVGMVALLEATSS
jgi:hypothetical protein